MTGWLGSTLFVNGLRPNNYVSAVQAANACITQCTKCIACCTHLMLECVKQQPLEGAAVILGVCEQPC